MVFKIHREVSRGLLLAHAFCGSIATSAIFGIGCLKILKLGKITDDILPIFMHNKSKKEDIINLGIKLMTRLYDDSFENLHKLRFFFIENSWPQLRKFL